jgi:CRP-like cAMP-binding protein
MEVVKESDNCVLIENGAVCFQHLTTDEIELIKKSKTLVQFRKGENLTKQGAFASYILFIIAGIVKQHVEGDANRNFNLRILQSGDFVGLSAVFNEYIFSYSTIALCETTVYLVEKTAIEIVIKQNGEFALGIIKRYCSQNIALYQIISNMMFKQMPGKLADALLYLSSDFFYNKDIFKHLTRKDIADFAGMSTESTVKLLKSFEKDKIIRLEEKNIIIENRRMLEEISHKG